MNIIELRLDLIRIDGETQARSRIDLDAVAEYAEQMMEGVALPPAVVFHDGAEYILADGFHRYHANRKIGAVTMRVELLEGTLHDAKLYAYAANKTHGLRRTNDDKRKAVLGMLALVPDWSDRAIAKHVGVSHPFVAALRKPEAAERQEANREQSAKKKAKVESDSTPAAEKPTTTATETASTVTAEQKAPGPVTVAEATEPAEDDGTEVDVLAEWEAAQKEIEALTGVLQAAEADDLKAEAMKWRRAYDNAVRKQSEAMDRCVTYERELQRQSRTIQRIGKAIGESNPSKVAAAVEALVKSQQVDA